VDILEGYFHNDPRIEEWLDQITEKIFTVCLLSGVDSDVEFQRGSQIVTKVTHLLQGISTYPSEYLEDGLKQLLEQHLPDSRVINNFPTFQGTMNKMLHEGMTRVINTQEKENLIGQDSSINNTAENTKEDAKKDTKENYIALCDENTGIQVSRINDEFVTEQIITALTSISSTITEDSSIVIASPLVSPSIPTKPYGMIRKTQIPQQADRLKYVLYNLFPNTSIYWNLDLMGHSFLAQVEDILICLHNPEQPYDVEALSKEGWKVYECSSNDLIFPRRLERGIRQIMRLRKQRKNG